MVQQVYEVNKDSWRVSKRRLRLSVGVEEVELMCRVVGRDVGDGDEYWVEL